MSILTKIQKIFFITLVCLIFSNLVPVHVFALSTNIRSESSTVKVGTSGTPVNLQTTDNFGVRSIDYNHYQALSISAKGGYDGTRSWVNPSTGQPYEQEKIYTIGTNNGTAYYYKPAGSTDDEQNANTVLLGYAVDGKVYFPQPTDSKGVSVNYIPKGGSSETNYFKEIDTARGLAAGTTQKNLTAVDRLAQNQETLATEQASLEELLRRQAADDAAINDPNTEGSGAMSPEDRAKLDQAIRDKQENIKKTQANIQSGVDSTLSPTINTEACDSWFGSVGSAAKIFKPACLITFLAMAANIGLKLSAFLLYIVGQLFDYSIEISVNSAEFIEKLGIVGPIWALIRDVLNMTFIFIIVLIAWQILTGRNTYNAKTSVARLVLVAVLINFSLFAAKIMIDASNVVSLNIYETMKVKGGSADETARGSISARIMTTLGLPGIYSFGDAFDGSVVPGCGGVPGTILTVGIFGTLLILIASMTFLLAALLFFIRMLNVIVLLITSPLWIWGYVIENPSFKKQTDRWLASMFHVMKFPVIYMLILYGSLAIFAQLNSAQVSSVNGQKVSFISMICQTTSSQGGGSVVDGIISQLPIVINFIIVIVCLIGAMIYAAKESVHGTTSGTKKMASAVSDRFVNFSKKITTGAAQNLYNKSSAAAGYVGDKALKGIALPGRAVRYSIRQKGYDLAEWASNKAAQASASSSSPKLQTAYAMLSQNLKDPSILGEKKEEGIKRRTATVVARAETLAKVQEEQLKVESKDAFEKKNPNGDYQKYLEEKVALIEKTYLGNLKDMVGKDNVVNSEALRANIFEDVKDDKGNIVGKKLNQNALYENIKNIKKYHENSKDEKESLLAAEKSSRWGFITTERAKARLKVKEKALEAARNKVRGGDFGVKKKEEEVEKLREALVKRLPDIDSLDIDNLSSSDVAKFDPVIRNYVQEYKNILKNTEQKINATRDPETEKVIKSETAVQLAELRLKTSEKREEEKGKIEDKIEKKLKEIETINEKNKKK